MTCQNDKKLGVLGGLRAFARKRVARGIHHGVVKFIKVIDNADSRLNQTFQMLQRFVQVITILSQSRQGAKTQRLLFYRWF